MRFGGRLGHELGKIFSGNPDPGLTLQDGFVLNFFNLNFNETLFHRIMCLIVVNIIILMIDFDFL